jgi:hypothetical protein
MICLVGASLAMLVEEELFFHSWMYRYMLKRLHPQGYDNFASIPFSAWSWAAWIVLNAIKGVYNDKEWQSYFISRLLFQWMIGRRRLFLDGLLTHNLQSHHRVLGPVHQPAPVLVTPQMRMITLWTACSMPSWDVNRGVVVLGMAFLIGSYSLRYKFLLCN